MPAGYGLKDSQRAKAMKLIEPGVMKVASGKTGAPVRGNPTAVSVQRNNARMNAMNPPPPAFKRGGKVEFDAEDRKAAKKAGLSKKAFEASAADKAQDKAEGYKRGGKVKEGSAADKREDARAAKKAGMTPAQYENSPADLKADAAGMKRGGKPRKYAAGGAAKVRKGVI